LANPANTPIWGITFWRYGASSSPFSAARQWRGRSPHEDR